MAKTWKLTYRFAVQGSTGKSSWTNVLHFNSNNAIASDAMKAEVDQVTAAFLPGLLSSVVIINATISDPAKRAAGYDPALVWTLPVGRAGNKAVADRQGEIKEVVVRLVANTGGGRGGHLSIRMALLDGEAVAGGNGDPVSYGVPAGVADIVTALNAAITAGVALHAYAKRKSGAITDKAIVAYSYIGVGYKSARRRKRKGIGKTKASLLDAAKTAQGAIQAFNATKALAASALGGGVALAAATAVENALVAAEPLLIELLPALL